MQTSNHKLALAYSKDSSSEVLERLRRIATGSQAWIDGITTHHRVDAQRIGQVVTTTDGQQLVALYPDAAARAIGMRSGSELVAALGDLVVPQYNGRRRRAITIEGTSKVVRCVCIDQEVWEYQELSATDLKALRSQSESFIEDLEDQRRDATKLIGLQKLLLEHLHSHENGAQQPRLLPINAPHR